MTDSEMTKAAAERVMKWKWSKETQTAYAYWVTPQGTASDLWNPFTSDSDAFMLVDALPEREIKIGRLGPYWTVDIGMRQCTSKDRRRAIVLAVLRAVGVEA